MKLKSRRLQEQRHKVSSGNGSIGTWISFEQLGLVLLNVLNLAALFKTTLKSPFCIKLYHFNKPVFVRGSGRGGEDKTAFTENINRVL